MKHVFWRKRPSTMHSRVVDLIWYILFVQYVRDEVLDMVIMIACCIWYNRNAVRHGSSQQLAQQVIQKAQMLITKFQAANHSVIKRKEELEARWTLLVISSYKVNVDG